MPQKTMYSAVNNSPQTTITASITATDAKIPVASVDSLPEAPNLITIGSDDDAEVVRYNGIDGLTLTGCERGFGGTTAKVWLIDELVYRAYTKYDHDTFKENIEDLDNNKLDGTGDLGNTVVTFTAATQRANVASGEKTSVLFGKVAKWFADLKALAFKDTAATENIDNGAVTDAKLADMPAETFKANSSNEAAPPANISAAIARKILNVADGADVTEDALDAAESDTVIGDTDKVFFIASSETAGEKMRSILWSTFKNFFGTVKSVNGGTPDSAGNVTVPNKTITSSMIKDNFLLPMKNGGTGKSLGSLAEFQRYASRSTWNGIYDGVDLSTVFDSAADFRTAIANEDFSKIHIGDYWPITLSGTFYDYATKTTKTLSNAVFKMEVASINPYRNFGDTAVSVPHIAMVSRDLLPITLQMRSEASTWYDDAAVNPWLGSALYQTLNNASNGIIALVEDTDLGAYIFSGPNTKGMRYMAETMAAGTAAPTSWAWSDRGKLFLLSEREVYGSPAWQTNSYAGGILYNQYPIFRGSGRHIIKGLGNGGSRYAWWLAGATSATNFCNVAASGNAANSSAANTNISVPLCFLIS